MAKKANKSGKKVAKRSTSSAPMVGRVKKKSAPKAPRGKGKAKVSGRRPAKAKAITAEASLPPALAQPAPTPDLVLRPQLLSDLAFAHSMVVKFADATPVEQALASPGPGHNHLVWQLGHLATGYVYFRELLDGKKSAMPESYNALFGWGSTLNADSSVYPPLAEVRANFDATYNAFIEAAKALPASELALPPVKDTGGMATQRLDVISRVAWHDGWHLGQIASIRRALGLPSAM